MDAAAPDPGAIREAARTLRAGGLVAFPTETVYGLGANALDPAAIDRIYAAKGRPSYNPLIVHVADADAARRLAAAWPAAADRLAEAFWPGPLTLVVPRAAHVPDRVSAGLATVALRVPAHPVALALLRAADLPVAAPSANRSTQVSPSTAAHVAKGLGERVDVILDGGPAAVGIESTVLDLTGPRPVLLRPGGIPAQALSAVVGEVVRPGAAPRDGEARPSPGMMDRHYAPRGAVRLFAGADAARSEAESAERAGHRVGAVVLAGTPSPALLTATLPKDPGGYAAGLYAALHDLDDAECDLILVEQVPPGDAWEGVRDRLRRAATPG